MRRFVEGIDRGQATLFPECLEDWIDDNNAVQVIDVFVDELDLAALGFDGVAPEALANATRLCAANFGLLALYENGAFRRPDAVYNVPEAFVALRARRTSSIVSGVYFGMRPIITRSSKRKEPQQERAHRGSSYACGGGRTQAKSEL